MKIAGIIAEYNPFHNGHAYQIEQIRRQTGADYIIAAMSGDFIQRGAPAILDKHTRAHMALACGVDLVIELPVIWSTSAAEDFAMAGVRLFEATGCTDMLCFGAETADLTLLSGIAEILADEPDIFRSVLADELKKGVGFPAARERAVLACVSDGRYTSAISGLMKRPNNILAIEYLKALRRCNSSIRPLVLERKGAAYHDTRIHIDGEAAAMSAPPKNTTAEPADGIATASGGITAAPGGIMAVPDCSGSRNSQQPGGQPVFPAASATAIRQLLLSGAPSSSASGPESAGNQPARHTRQPDTDSLTCSALAASMPENASHTTSMCDHTSSAPAASMPENTSHTTSPCGHISSALAASMPKAALAVLMEALREKPMLSADDFSALTGYRLLSTTPAELFAVAGCTEAIANRLYRERYHFTAVSSFCAYNKTRDVTYTRLARILLCLVLGITKQDTATAKEAGWIPWLRVLGFRREAAPLLTRLKECADVPILTKLADAEPLLNPPAYALLQKDMSAGELYRQMQIIRRAPHRHTAASISECSRPLVIC